MQREDSINAASSLSVSRTDSAAGLLLKQQQQQNTASELSQPSLPDMEYAAAAAAAMAAVSVQIDIDVIDDDNDNDNASVKACAVPPSNHVLAFNQKYLFNLRLAGPFARHVCHLR